MTAHVDPDSITAPCLVGSPDQPPSNEVAKLIVGVSAPPLAPSEQGLHDPVFEALRIFAAFYEWALPDAEWLQGVDPKLAPPTCEIPIVRFPMTRGFQFAEPDKSGAVRAVVHVVTGWDAETSIGVVAWCLDRPDDIYRYPMDIPALGIDQLDNPSSYFAGAALPIHRTPLAWLKAGCHGIVPLDNDALWEVLRALPYRDDGYRLLVEDIDHGRELRDDKLCPLPPSIHLCVRPQGAS